MPKVEIIPAKTQPEYIRPLKVAAYCRVGTQQEMQYHSLEAQRDYTDISVGEIAAQENINQTAKGMLRGIISALIAKEHLPNLSLIINEDPSALKTIRLDRYGQLKESMSLPSFRYCEIAEETWECSQLRAFFFERLFVLRYLRYEKKSSI